MSAVPAPFLRSRCFGRGMGMEKDLNGVPVLAGHADMDASATRPGPVLVASDAKLRSAP